MLLNFINSATDSWSNLYGNHTNLSVTIRFLHMSALVLGGGAGMWTDWQILRKARTGPEDKETILNLLSRVHPYVVPWMIVLGVTGLLMAAADSSVFLASKVFWTKMALVMLLISNGMVLLVLENRARRNGVAAAWPGLMAAALMSAALWQSTIFVGALLTVAA